MIDLAVRRAALLDRLSALLPAEFDDLVYRLGVPAQFLTTGGPQATRAIEVLRYLEPKIGIDEMERSIRGILGPLPGATAASSGTTAAAGPSLSAQAAPTGPLTVVLYTKRDAGEWEELSVHLAPLRKSGAIDLADPSHVHHVGLTLTQLRRALVNNADLVLVLVTHSLFDDDALMAEVEHAIKRAKSNETRVIPILVRPSQWKESILGGLAALPQNETPVVRWRLADEAWHSIAEGLRAVVTRTPRRAT